MCQWHAHTPVHLDSKNTPQANASAKIKYICGYELAQGRVRGCIPDRYDCVWLRSELVAGRKLVAACSQLPSTIVTFALAQVVDAPAARMRLQARATVTMRITALQEHMPCAYCHQHLAPVKLHTPVGVWAECDCA